MEYQKKKNELLQVKTTIQEKIKELDVNFTEVKKMDTSEKSRKYSVKYLNYNFNCIFVNFIDCDLWFFNKYEVFSIKY